MNKLKNKKVALITEYYYSDLGGAEKSIKKIAENIKDIDIYTFEPDINKKNNFKLKENIFRFYKINKIAKIIKNLDLSKYDYILTQSLIAPFIVNKYPKKSIYFIRDELNLNEFKNYETGLRKYLKTIKDILESQLINKYKKANEKALKNAHLIVANSKFMQSKLKKKFNRESMVIYPEIEKINLEKRKPEYILFVGYGNPYKGSEIAHKLAKKLKNQKFLFIGKGIKKKIIIENITYIPWGQNMSKIYGKTKLLIVPSIWEEAFGRVVCEAQTLNIPVICSNKGGLPEANKNKNNIIDKIFDIKEWIKKISKNIR